MIISILAAVHVVWTSSEDLGPHPEPDFVEPSLIDDVRYSPRSAAFWRSLGLEIAEEHVTEIDDLPIDVVRGVDRVGNFYYAYAAILSQKIEIF